MEDYYREMNQRLFEELYQDYDWSGDVCSRWPRGPGDCPVCEEPTVLRHGPYGRFYGCSDFPDCRGIRRWDPELVPSKKETFKIEVEIRTRDKFCGEDCGYLSHDPESLLPVCGLFNETLEDEDFSDDTFRCKQCLGKTKPKKWWVTYDD